MSQGERANLIIAGHKAYGEKGLPAWAYPYMHSNFRGKGYCTSNGVVLSVP